jgi:hypothetical protein
MLRSLPVLGLIFFVGCSSLTPVPYVLAETEEASALISFTSGNPRVTPIYYNDEEFPKPEKGTVWNPVSFPAALPLEITVHAYFGQQSSSSYNPSIGLLGALIVSTVESAVAASRTVDIDVLFNCPPLEPGKKYALDFRKEAGTPGKNKLILTDTETRKIIYQQEFEVH